MNEFQLSKQELAELRALHRKIVDKRYEERVKAVILLAEGCSTVKVAKELLMGPDKVALPTIQRWICRGLVGP